MAMILVVLGGVLMVLAPEMWVGIVLLALGIAVEVAGIALERKT
jgi:hypothetical protein